MKQYKETVEEWLEVIGILEKSMMTDRRRYPQIRKACRIARKTGNYDLLYQILQEHPWIIHKALERLIQDPFLPLPLDEELSRLKGEIKLGVVNHYQEWTYWGFSMFLLGVFIFGATGSGKSYPVLRLIRDILRIPIEERGFNLLIVQALKQDADFLIRDHKNLGIFEWTDLRLAPLETEDWDEQFKKVNSFCNVYDAINWNQMHSSPLLRRSLTRALNKQATPNFIEIKAEIDGAAKDIDLGGFQHKNTKDHLTLGLEPFTESGEILNGRYGFTIQDFFSKEDIILNVNREIVPKDKLLGTIITDIFVDLQRYYLKYPVHPPRLRTLIIIDESRRIFPSEKEYGDTEHDPQAAMVEFVTTRRASGIGLIAITQSPGKAPSWLVENSSFLIGFPK
jgi:hypothetical protein